MQTVQSPPTQLWCADRLSASIDGPGLQRAYVIDKPFILVGSSERCDIVVPLVEAPPVALYIHVTDDAICWLDLSSPSAQWRSGTFAATGRLVWRGYHIALDRLAARSRETPSVDDRPPSALPGDSLADVPIFDVDFDGERLARAKLTGAMTLIGQSERCRLRLRNRHVSHDHCLCYVSERRAWVVDLLSDEGTFVRGQRVAASAVFAGDAVTIGKPQLTFVRWSRRKTSLHDQNAASDSALAIADDSRSALVADEASDSPIVSSTPMPTLPDDAIFTESESSDEAPRKSVGLADTVVDAASLRDTVVDPPAPNKEASAEPSRPTGFPDGKSTATAPIPTATIPTVDTPPAAAPRAFAEFESPNADAGTLLRSPLAAVPGPLSTPDPSLDRLIVRHKRNYVRTIVRWSVASSVILAAFLSAVVWASRNLDFYEAGSERELKMPPPTRNDAAPPRQRASSTQPTTTHEYDAAHQQPGEGESLGAHR